METPIGMEKLRPDDHFMVLLESDANPMNLGSLLILDTSTAGGSDVFEQIRCYLIERLPLTPVLRELRRSPLSFDSDVWVQPDNIDFEHHIVRHHSATAMTDVDLRDFVADHVSERLDLARPPFRIHVLDNVADNRAALYVKLHHAVSDGVGFQTFLSILGGEDPAHDAQPVRLLRDDELPGRHRRLAASVGEFRALRASQPERTAIKDRAKEALRDPALQRPAQPAPTSISGVTSDERSFAMISISFPRIKVVGKALGGTVNDIYLAVIGTAMRNLLLDLGDLPELSLLANAARSYRRAEHGLYGNRIVAIRPSLATNVADPLERLAAIQASMALERQRTPHEEALLGQPEVPFGPYNRRANYAARRTSGAAVLQGNLSASNVPGPAESRSVAGFMQLGNYPTPILGQGRSINFTARRNADCFDVGLMVDPTRIPDVDHLARLFEQALDVYEELASS